MKAIWSGRNFDFLTSNISLPVGGLVVCMLVSVKAWDSMKEEIRCGSNVSSTFMNAFRWVIMIACPLLILTVLITGLI